MSSDPMGRGQTVTEERPHCRSVRQPIPGPPPQPHWLAHVGTTIADRESLRGTLSTFGLPCAKLRIRRPGISWRKKGELWTVSGVTAHLP